MEHIISEILEYCQNDMSYLQEIVDKLQEKIDNNKFNVLETRFNLRPLQTCILEALHELSWIIDEQSSSDYDMYVNLKTVLLSILGFNYNEEGELFYDGNNVIE